jgi:hypothetical protein
VRISTDDLLPELSDKVYNHCQQYAEKNHGGKGKIKPEVFPLNAYVTRQPSYPMQLVAKKVNNGAKQDNDSAE